MSFFCFPSFVFLVFFRARVICSFCRRVLLVLRIWRVFENTVPYVVATYIECTPPSLACLHVTAALLCWGEVGWAERSAKKVDIDHEKTTPQRRYTNEPSLVLTGILRQLVDLASVAKSFFFTVALNQWRQHVGRNPNASAWTPGQCSRRERGG